MDRKTVLLVDDSSDMLALQRTLLESEGYRVLTALSYIRKIPAIDV